MTILAQQYSVGMVALAVLAGGLFSLIGIAYRMGQSRGIAAGQIALVICVFGCGYFGWQCRAYDWAAIPLFVWVVGIAVGLGQYMAVQFVRLALARGPLTPMWCAINLAFVPAIAYAGIFLGEAVAPFQYAGIATGMACVVVAACSQQAAGAGGSRAASWRGLAAYGAVLMGILLFNSGMYVGLKALSARDPVDGRPFEKVYGDMYFLLLQIGLGAPLLLEALARRQLKAIAGWPAILGLLGGIGSIGGSLTTRDCMCLPATVVFTTGNIASILAASLASVLFFGERRTPTWYATLTIAILTVLLFFAADWQSIIGQN